MPHAELDRLEGDVRDARRRLKSDLEILRAPETFSSFKEEVLDEARQSRDGIVANVKEAATDRAERLVADIKARAAANPVPSVRSPPASLGASSGNHPLRPCWSATD